MDANITIQAAQLRALQEIARQLWIMNQLKVLEKLPDAEDVNKVVEKIQKAIDLA